MPISSSYAGQAASKNIYSHAMKLILKYYEFVFRNCPPVLPFKYTSTHYLPFSYCLLNSGVRIALM
jgi:hypothetical protein